MAPLGIIGFIDDHNITLRDNDFSVFIRSFGAVMGGQGTTAVYALGTIDRKSLTALEPLVNSVYSKLNLGLDEKQCWDKFIGESGSNLIYKYLNIYRDTVALGGPPEPIGTVVGSSMLEQTLLREKKDMLAKGFIVLLVPMHIAMIGIFVALYQILLVLTGSVASMMNQMQNMSSASGGQSAGDFHGWHIWRWHEPLYQLPGSCDANLCHHHTHHSHCSQYYRSANRGRGGSIHVLFLRGNILHTDRICSSGGTNGGWSLLQCAGADEYGGRGIRDWCVT